ncbi:MAG: hypothetical protein NT170_02605 [Candidatus Moranbacteria bacterium]|nr:hypothetical protein [Candidatus Moranbacteria bacterium]
MEKDKKLKIGVVIYTFDRVDDAKINMEIIRNLWSKLPVFSDITIVHAYNGKKGWYPKKYLENSLVRMKNPGHFQGASDLIDAGTKILIQKKDIDYVIVLASDTWLLKPEYIAKAINEMRKKDLYLATCPWGLPNRNDIRDVGVATDFFCLDIKWARKYKLFPLRYKEFYKKYGEYLLYKSGSNVMLEKLMLMRFMQAIRRVICSDNLYKAVAKEKIYWLSDREPVHSHINKRGLWVRKMLWEKIGLETSHDLLQKKKFLKKFDFCQGKNTKRLLGSKDLNYFNESKKGNKGQY